MADNKLNLVVQFSPLDKLSGAMRNIIGLGRSGGQVLGQMRRTARDLDGELKDVRQQMARSTGNITQLVDRERDLEAQVAQANRQLERQKSLLAFQGRVGRISARGEQMRSEGQSNVGTGTAGLLAIGVALKGGVEFDGVMADIGIKLGINERLTATLAQQILTAAKNSNQLPSTMQAAADTLASVGLTAKEIPAMLGDIGKVATAYNALPEDLAGAASASIKNLGVEANQTGKALALMAVAGKAGKFEIKDMAAQFPQLAATAASLGQKGLGAVADLSAASQFVAEGVGGDMSTAANNLNNLLAKINTEDVRKNFKEMGIDLPAAMKAAYAQGKTPIEAIAELTKKALGGNMENLALLFGDMQAQDALKQLVPKLDAYRALRADIQKQTGQVEDDFARKSATAQSGLLALMGDAQAIGVTIGSTVLPNLVEFTGYLRTGADWLNRFSQQHPLLIKYLVMGAAATATFKIGLGVLQFGFGGMLGMFAKALPLLNVARIAFLFLARGVMQAGMMMLANPLVLAIVAIGAAVGTLAYLVYANWGKISGAFTTGFNYVKGLLAAAPAWMRSLGSMMMQGLLAALNPMLLANRLLSIARTGITAFKQFFGIKSPSRLFMEMGGHMTSGLAIGVERGGKQPLRAMNNLTGQLAASGNGAKGPTRLAEPAPNPITAPGRTMARGASARREPGAGMSAAPITIQIYQQPGESADTLADRVMQMLEAKQRTARLSSYRDDF